MTNRFPVPLARAATVLSVVSAALLLAACAAPRNASLDAFDAAHRAFEAGDLAAAHDGFDALIKQSGRAVPDGLLARAHRFRADCLVRQKRYALARLDFDKAVRLARSADPAEFDIERIVWECRIAAGDTYLHEKSYHIADRTFASLLEEPLSPAVRDALLFRRYICALHLGRPDADGYLKQITSLAHFDAPALRRAFLPGGIPAAAPSASTPRADRTATDRLAVIPRSAWHAAAVRSNVDPMTRIRRITIHHTADIWTETDYAATAERIRYYQRMHQEAPRSWADIGYHFLIDYSGRIWEGRSLRYQGAHAGNAQLNAGNIGVVLLGDFDVQTLNDRQQNALAGLLAALTREYSLAPDSIVTHLELKVTACPGRNLQRFVQGLRMAAAP